MTDSIDPEALKKQLKQELALRRFQELATDLVPRCFSKCVIRPGLKLDSYEQSCLARCTDQYQEVMQVVSKRFLKKLEQGSMQD
ncbi:hypothetical protein BATDEDRAFT_85704 [Batrachochytrium dendrobatidis JAM81]|uniref:Mitochondrial import inner membrane translocase subunit n=1 Tax=Batrachochytrium dendrobatidis (strain JAM81 / FGSC 10211) TaxID=684364 RepID=F4NSA2_BATDJ|nr:uncharacterized protein BATDEDRAFT_85704 [Batrachochytrium dendrobatidis JAM81]EGF83012.1 hypothetical protein BATDEDRAFT_85704 [Batrachochytrium dendrobatidis JAM81]KAJ8331571.1 Mitochondrial import inner membrane translocase subunit Tim13 [Batrachochytrium dendrobatidis]KAK5672021.1 Mitochondrial import inner membrane translocase subunit Tim13 [Batrachochytrium dendrobatidis]|eukprot:XP_006675946.1 hypothetical protein BATDEDRAFT_85704 [Batrachochytrium dendrobatidis JAM81]